MEYIDLFYKFFLYISFFIFYKYANKSILKKINFFLYLKYSVNKSKLRDKLFNIKIII